MRVLVLLAALTAVAPEAAAQTALDWAALDEVHVDTRTDRVVYPEAVRALHGRTVRVEGFRLPPEPDRVAALLGALDVAHRRRALPQALSQGERQRVASARAVACRPALLLADEPTSALDDARADAVAQLLLRLAEDEGATLVVATHDARLLPLFDHRLTLHAP